MTDDTPNLHDPDTAIRRSAVLALAAQTPLTAAALAALETAAAHDPDPDVRQAALTACQSPAARRAQAAGSQPLGIRLEVLEQIEGWRATGLLSGEQAAALRLRFNFDLTRQRLTPAAWNALNMQISAWEQNGAIEPGQAAALHAHLETIRQPGVVQVAAPTPVVPVENAAPAQPAAAPAPNLRVSTANVIFSEVSIRIALYLGGFLIVAAALILAAVLEFARLPILLGITALTGATALLLRPRLALPSFVLFIIFASLLPIDAGVAADLFELLPGDATNTYWAIVLAGETLVLALATSLYRSRLFSLAALISLDAAAIFLAGRIASEYVEQYLLLLVLVGLTSAAWQNRLQRRLDKRFVQPLRWLTHLQMLPLLGITAFVTLLYIYFTYDPNGESVNAVQRLVMGAAWLAAAGFYLLGDLGGQPFGLLPWLSAGALAFAPWIVISAPALPKPWTEYILMLAGFAIAIGGEALARLPDGRLLRRYGAPLLFAAIIGVIWAIGIGWIEDRSAALVIPAAAGLFFTLLHARKPRLGIWLAALAGFLAAWFTLFQHPISQSWHYPPAYQAAWAGLALLALSLLRPSKPIDAEWLLPARFLGAGITAINTLAMALGWAMDTADLAGNGLPPIDWGLPAWVFSITAGVLLLLALRRNIRPVGYFAAGYISAATACWLAHSDQPHLMLPLSALAGAFYLIGLGLLLARRDAAWARVPRHSGLALSLALFAFLPAELSLPTLRPGLALLLGSVLFLTELHIRRGGWLELPMLALLIAGSTRLLRLAASGVTLPGWDLALVSLLVLGCDLYFSRRGWPAGANARLRRYGLRALGGLLVAGAVLFWTLHSELPARQPALLALLYALFFGVAAQLYRFPRLAYLTVAFLAGGLFYALRAAGQTTWLAPEILLAAGLYGASFILGRSKRIAPAWREVFHLGGLALAMLVSLTAPLESTGLAASLWVTVAASLYAIEAFRRRNVWLGFPANGLYLLAYFILLFRLEVREPQYYSMAVAILGLLMHYLLVRSGSRLGAFLTGLISQLVLLGTTYVQMVSTNRLGFFIMLFFQGLVVLGYGIVTRSRSLVLAPIVFIVVGVITVVLSVLSGIPTAIIIGCTGILLLIGGILALLMRERLSEFSDRFGGWRA